MKRTFLVLIIVLAGAISAFAVETQQASASSEMAVADTSRIENLSDTAAVVATLSSEEREAIADVVREEMNSNRSFYNDDMPVRISAAVRRHGRHIVRTRCPAATSTPQPKERSNVSSSFHHIG